jgi:hypothetical protein
MNVKEHLNETLLVKRNVKEHLNETLLVKRNSLTSITTFFIVDI